MKMVKSCNCMQAKIKHTHWFYLGKMTLAYCPACLHCQLSSLPVHHQKWCYLPSHKHKRYWADKITQSGQILPPPSCFLLWMVH